MYGILILLDLTLAVLTLIAAPVAGVKASRRWLIVLAALAAGRLVLALLLLTGGLLLADSRLSVQVPLALLPAAWAAWRPGRTTAHLSAAGAVLSVWWLLAPFAPQDTVLVLAGSAAALGLVFWLSTATGRRRESSRLARLPWTAAALLLVPATTLVLAGQADASADGHQHGGSAALSVEQLTGPKDQTPAVRKTLVAARTEVRLTSGATVDALTFNGSAPGPEIRVERGRLLEVTLVNQNVEEGVTVHWHGVDVPNAEDGVPGVTQDAVMPGGRHVYRFTPDRAGTFWYHTHRDGLLNVKRGLFGALIVEEPVAFDGLDRTVFTHAWPGSGRDVTALDRADQPAGQDAPAGRKVLLRTVNSSEEPQTVRLAGAPFQVAAIDGNAVPGATALEPGTELQLAAGGRYDLAFTMPAGAVTLSLGANPDAALTFSPGGAAGRVSATGGGQFDPLAYGSGSEPGLGGHDRTFDLRLDDGFGFSQGRLSYVSSLINGRLYPAVPALEVERGDRVRMRIASRSTVNHPFHLHGHRVRVLARNGDPVSGSPWWTDTLNIGRGEVYEIEFRADNPGIWMDHCHNFQHGANGMIMHLAYTGVSTAYSSEHAPE
ncbi:multicopper oxidase family protein [Actinoplanes sp. TRM 88003]|uniref:Multicopper oxidase family protein n=1 Tax=Paractinoplanes aksuensis TaxID=2939490 RepID=A0ABT1DS38_9ACTN|nr:multicopper oxidase domain-containing protein [Actinoplanes aksuensis]MCO8273654.1 multicopper oxidase family protein [Actinoplanes aksuensis]